MARNGKFQIYARIIVDREKAELATGLFVKQTDWFEDAGKAKSTAINDEISEVENSLRRIRRKILDGNGILTAKAIKSHYKGGKRFNVGIKEYFNKHKGELELLKESGKISEGTVKHYRTTEKHLSAFVQMWRKGGDVGINEIEYSFINEFDLYLRSKYKSKADRSISNNYANKQHSRLRTVLHKAVREGFINVNPYQTFRLKAEKTVRDYLTESELNLLTDHSLQGNLSLQRVRDCFLFSCYTGLRYEDAFNLKMTDINYEADGTVSLSITMGKTNDRVYVPLLEPAIRIMNHYSDDDARKVFNFVLPRYSNQKVNTFLKAIVDLVGINKELTHHVARHTCATLLLNKGMPIEVVQKILGHADIRTTKIYAKMLNTTIKAEMARVSKLL